jgi:hypothetical protein
MKREYNFSKLKELKNPYPGKKRAGGINLSREVVDDFKGWRKRGECSPKADRSLPVGLRNKRGRNSR